MKKNKNTPIMSSSCVPSIDDDFDELRYEFINKEEYDALSVEVDFMGTEPENNTGPWGNI